MNAYFIGIDVGTQGARAVLLDQEGVVLASQSKKFMFNKSFREEQSPLIWWADTITLLEGIFQNLPASFSKKDISAISVTSTSGTVIPLDKYNNPIHPAIMYSDGRSSVQGAYCKKTAQEHNPDGYTGFNASSGISKMRWFSDTFPEKINQLALWVHASDFIIGKLSGVYQVTDYTNALKSAYDLDNYEWPEFVHENIGIRKEWLQEVVPSGSVIGKLTADLAARWNIPVIDVVVGMTDGYASQIASGAVNVGDWNTTIGTTLVIKGVTKSNVVDPFGRVYSHRHPEGYWMPGGASNTGADWISLDFDAQVEALNKAAEELAPTGQLAWPLKQSGERFPFIAPDAKGFFPAGLTQEELYTANLEGVAFIERLAYETLAELSHEEVRSVYTGGGGSNSEVWLKIRSAVLNLPIFKCKESTGAAGAAIMAASKTYYQSISDAVSHMTQIEKEIRPNPAWVAKYELQYQAFKQKLVDLNYINL